MHFCISNKMSRYTKVPYPLNIFPQVGCFCLHDPGFPVYCRKVLVHFFCTRTVYTFCDISMKQTLIVYRHEEL